jgi:uncharacterized protein YegP (UPF0339 family)
MTVQGRVEVYQRKDGAWSWRRVAADGTVTATSAESFAQKADAHLAATAGNAGLPVGDADLKSRH